MFQQVVDKFSVIAQPFGLQDLPLFPYTEWMDIYDACATAKDWYSGEALDDVIQDKQTGKKIDQYPIRVNPIKNSVAKHVATLFGEFPEDFIGPIVKTKVIKDDAGISKEVVNKIEDTIEKVWEDNLGGSLMYENGFISQIYGGCIFRVKWNPLAFPKVGIEIIYPWEFIAIPYPDNYWKLKEAWVIRQITDETALIYGVKIHGETAYYIEHWTEKEYTVQINDHILTIDIMGENYLYNGANPFGFVPFVYIPHVRVGKFLGEGVITTAVQGLVKEINARLADVGDAASEDAHSIVAMRHVKGAPQIVRLADGYPVVNLGGAASITGTEKDPDMFAVDKKLLTDPMININAELFRHYRREIGVPAVADGEDEGSQRSALTLTTRMWPLVSHTKGERVHWSTGLVVLNRMILSITAMFGAKSGYPGISVEYASARLKSKWYSALPRDRAELLNEISIRATHNIGSLRHFMEMAGDIEDADEQIAEIEKQQRLEKEINTPPPTAIPGLRNEPARANAEQKKATSSEKS